MDAEVCHVAGLSKLENAQKCPTHVPQCAQRPATWHTSASTVPQLYTLYPSKHRRFDILIGHQALPSPSLFAPSDAFRLSARAIAILLRSNHAESWSTPHQTHWLTHESNEFDYRK